MAVLNNGLEIERVRWDALKPHAENPRNGDVEAIAESIRANGIFRPVIIARDGTILAGHHLWHALGELGREEVDVVRIDVDPYTPAGRRILLADNRTADLGRYDDGLLLEMLDELDKNTVEGLLGTGYDADLLDRLRNRVSYDDWTDPEPGERAPHTGLRWKLGGHTLVCGDSTDPTTWSGCPPVAAIITDPPYGYEYSGGRSLSYQPIANDGDGQEAADTITAAFAAIPKRPGTVYYTFTGIGNPQHNVISSALEPIGAARWMLIWLKTNHNISRADYNPKHEVIWYGWHDTGHPPVVDQSSSTILEYAAVRGDLRDHQNQKPLALMERLVGAHGFSGGAVIADPFAGAGTTLLACENASLRCWAVEMDPDYCQAVISRWEKSTGEVAEQL